MDAKLGYRETNEDYMLIEAQSGLLSRYDSRGVVFVGIETVYCRRRRFCYGVETAAGNGVLSLRQRACGNECCEPRRIDECDQIAMRCDEKARNASRAPKERKEKCSTGGVDADEGLAMLGERLKTSCACF